jgi:hypothetical protein
MEELIDDIRNFMYDNESYAIIEETDTGLSIFLDLPSEISYQFHIDLVYEFFREFGYDIEDCSVDGDYEGCITIDSDL